MTLKKEEFYGPHDLICGNKIVIYNRECLICNCDDSNDGRALQL